MDLITETNYYLGETSEFLGVCDKIRRNGDKEDWWNHMIDDREEITEDEFLSLVDVSDVLDDGETWYEYKSGLSDDIRFYRTDDVVFFQTAGFEYFWKV